MTARGFTLIQAMMVTAIIVIIGAVAIPTCIKYSHAMKIAKVSRTAGK